ncbi:hypothetical protein Amet_0857 [Alkaliphilus metalliredigens QYMF]|uniref:PIN domain-containing protein n=1 Tax=Alkaliphilus metalliredigens (strain QYMF) TaxID=293826 RepID=A6TLL4_ALKMQ|nr:hypothetical protein [Alkaliphilus metalliredigens]ABR47082.1 hypothetical protein Amet_0857 [Alkaliphilus metalliredigens QYMF]
MKKYVGAISDTDILINLAKVDGFNVLENLFEEIIIPHFIYDVELRKKAGKQYGKINTKIQEPNSIFKVVDRKKDFVVNKAAIPIIEEYNGIMGPGESECTGYAAALDIPIIVSDNVREFKYFDEEFIPLTHNSLLVLNVHFKQMEFYEGQIIFNGINETLTQPLPLSFQEVCHRTKRQFNQKGWNDYLGL